MATPTVDLRRASVLQEIVVRGGNVRAQGARATLQGKYERDDDYPDVIGLSTVSARAHRSMSWPAPRSSRTRASVGR